MQKESIKLQDGLEDINIFKYLKEIDKLHLVSFISQIPLPIAILNTDARFLGVNQKFADIYDSDALYLTDKLLNTFSTIVYAHFKDALVAFAQKQNYYEQEFYIKGKFYISYFKAIYDQENKIDTIIVICSDVTRLKRRENVLLQNNKKLHDHLYLDALTGLPNAFAFDHYLEQLWQRQRTSDTSFLKIDLDNFKLFNRLNSYTKGDEVLIQLSVLLNDSITQTEAQIFRLNSANFVVVIENFTQWAVMTLAERFKYAILEEQISIGDDGEFLTASVGIYHLEQDSKDIDITHKLNTAVRFAKDQGKNSLYLLNN